MFDAIPFPEDNPYSEAKAKLGKALFFDPRLSQSGKQSCASCHNPALGWEDGRRTGIGHRGAKLSRHVPTLLNIAWAERFNWDGAAASLAAQAKRVFNSEREMATGVQDAVARVRAIDGYAPMFARAFPDRGLTTETFFDALATYERTIVSPPAPFDRWVDGDDDAISAAAKRGFKLFNGKANCAACHAGWRFTDDSFHDIGLRDDDPGRNGVMEMDIAVMQHAFKTPTLRNVTERAPYMHDGSIATLRGVIKHYEDGFVKRKSLSREMKPLDLSKRETADLIAFLKTLTSHQRVTVPNLPNR